MRIRPNSVDKSHNDLDYKYDHKAMFLSRVYLKGVVRE